MTTEDCPREDCDGTLQVFPGGDKGYGIGGKEGIGWQPGRTHGRCDTCRHLFDRPAEDDSPQADWRLVD
jgi:hypothetical protein